MYHSRQILLIIGKEDERHDLMFLSNLIRKPHAENRVVTAKYCETYYNKKHFQYNLIAFASRWQAAGNG